MQPDKHRYFKGPVQTVLLGKYMTKKIMIIDDEPDIRIYLISVLEDNGYLACSHNDDVSIVESIRKEKPNLIILDIMMPGRSGISIYKELKNQPDLKDIPVALISGIPSTSSFNPEGFRALAHDDSLPMPASFIDKPIKIEPFLKLVENMLGDTTV
jgi:CheY-like chemotaxis protein